MTTTWQERAALEMNELGERIEKLRTFLIGGPKLDAQVLGLMQEQYAGMVTYYGALSARLRLAGMVDVETPPLVREERGEPAAVEVTVTAPAGKRAQVTMMHGEIGGSVRTVTEGHSQTWACVGGEIITVREGEPHSTVAHKRGNG